MHILKNIRLTSKDVFRDANNYLFYADDVFEFFTAWVTLLFLALVLAPLVLILWILATPVYFFLLLFKKKEPKRAPKVVTFPLKDRPDRN